MKSFKELSAVAVLAGMTLAGCDRSQWGVIEPSADAMGVSARASGHFEVQATPAQNIVVERVSFTARGDGVSIAADGQLQARATLFSGGEFGMHGEVTCLSVAGNQAWIGGRITHVDFNGKGATPPPVGGAFVLRVADGGEGNDTADLASLIFFGQPPGGELTHCATQPAFPVLRATSEGNVNVASK